MERSDVIKKKLNTLDQGLIWLALGRAPPLRWREGGLPNIDESDQPSYKIGGNFAQVDTWRPCIFSEAVITLLRFLSVFTLIMYVFANCSSSHLVFDNH